MSDDQQQPRKRIRIPTPKELDESTGDGQPQQDESQEQKGVRSRVRRFRMRMRGGVGRNKKVLRGPRPDAGSVKEPAPDRQDPGDVESSVSEPSSEPVIGHEGGQEEVVSSEKDTGTDPVLEDEVVEENKQEEPPGSRIRTIKKSPGLTKEKKEQVSVSDDDTKTRSRWDLAQKLAHQNAQENDHDIDMDDFVDQVCLDRDKKSIATCNKCGLKIEAVLAFGPYDVKGTPLVGGNAKDARCQGLGRGYSSGTS